MIIFDHLVFNKGEWKNCFIKRKHQNIGNVTKYKFKRSKKNMCTLSISADHGMVAVKIHEIFSLPRD